MSHPYLSLTVLSYPLWQVQLGRLSLSSSSAPRSSATLWSRCLVTNARRGSRGGGGPVWLVGRRPVGSTVYSFWSSPGLWVFRLRLLFVLPFEPSRHSVTLDILVLSWRGNPLVRRGSSVKRDGNIDRGWTKENCLFIKDTLLTLSFRFVFLCREGWG